MTTWLLAAAAFLLLLSLLPLTKIPHGFVRGPAFARLQATALAGLLILPTVLLFSGQARWLTLLVLGLTILINAIYIAKFTPLWPLQSKSASPAQCADKDAQISILAANIKMSNRSYDRFLALTRDHPADVVVVIEPDAEWIGRLQPLKESHPHCVEHPLDTGYGLALYSTLPLSDTRLADRVTDGVPSIETTVTLRNGEDIVLYAVHPEPPVASHDTKGRDSEIALTGIEARQNPLPAIVTGDLNDVAWSTTTRRFQRLSGLLDPRVGRGFYNTFHARYPLFRWPLDHLFHGPRFRLVRLDRLADIGSDHFPIFFELALTPSGDNDAVPAHDPGEAAEVREMIEKEARRPRDPIGKEWEQREDR